MPDGNGGASCAAVTRILASNEPTREDEDIAGS
jgi:hypothetical protein